MDEKAIAERPNAVPWPPLLLLAGIAAGAALGALLPIPFPLIAALQIAGYFLIAIGIVFDFSAIWTMWRARTNILPHKAAGTLVTNGPFRFSRNPIYVGNTITLFAMALAFSNLWYAAAAFAMAFLVDRLAIRREEIHLALRFGETWNAYASRTPRWLF
jgi:protein-S-isoprenylcysteine O-methyltransferase Ste14